MNNTTLTTNQTIEIGKDVQWTQTIMLNQTSDRIAIEIPDDAKNVIVIDNNQIISQSDVSIISSEATISTIEKTTDSIDGTAMISIDDEESPLILLDEIVPIEDGGEIKFVVVSDDVKEIVIQYETSAPYTIEKETDGDNSYEKKIKVKSDSVIHYSNVRSYSSIPEEYVLQGIPFTLDWLINGTRVNVIDDERFDVQFEDVDGNGLIDQMSWIVPQLSEKVFSINADTAESDDVGDVSSKLQQMKEKLDSPFYDKTLQMVNAKVMGKLEEYLVDDRKMDESIVGAIDNFEYYSIVMIVPNIDESGLDRKTISNQNKDELVKILQQHDAKNIYRAEHLSFVTAQVLASEISKISDLGVVFRMGDGEIEIVPTTYQYGFDSPANSDVFKMDKLKNIVNADGLSYDGTGVIVSILDKDETITTNHDDLPDSTILYRLLCQPDEDIPNNEDDVDVVVDCVNVSTAFGWHPTHVAGIIAGQGNLDPNMEGIATDAQIIGARQVVKNTAPFFLEGIDRSLRLGSDIITVVYGFYSCGDNYTTIELILDESVDEGLVVVSGAGNRNTIISSACGYNTISVGGIDPQSYLNNENDILAAQSSKGPSGKSMLKPELVAPSQKMWVLTGDNDYAERDGTSLSAPFVSGASAILKEANPYYTPLEIKSALLLGAKWDPVDNIDLDSRTNKAIAASNYELVATSTTNIISTTLNSYGFGLLDVEQSLAYTPRLGISSSSSLTESHIIRDTISNGITQSYDIIIEPEDIGNTQKIILSWLSQPRFTTELKEVPVSNLDFVLRDGQNNIVATSNSEHQNNEFVVFIPETDGTYTIQVTGTSVNTIFIQNEKFTLASTLKIKTDDPNSKPTIPLDAFTKPGVIRSCSSLGQTCDNDYYPVDIYLQGDDTDGDILSFYIKAEPQHGTLSTVLKDTRTSGRVIYQPDPNFPEYPTKDYFEFGVYDGKSISSTKRVEIIQHHIVPENQLKTGESEPDDTETKNPGRSRYQKTTSFDSPTTESSGLWILSSVSGSLFFFASPESGVQINANEATLIDFVDDQNISGINFAAQDTYDSDFVKIGFVPSGDIPTTNFPPTARIEVSPESTSITGITFDELTTVTLDGTTSTDFHTDTASLDYTWTITTNSAIDPVSLSSIDDSIVTFRAPSYPIHPTQEFIVVQLTVEDNGNPPLSHTVDELIWIESVAENTDNPIARNDAFRIPSNSGTHSLDILDNDHPDKNALTVHSIGISGTLGIPSISSDGKSINYASCADCTSDSFTYTVSDGTNISSPGLVTLTIGESFDVFASSRISNDVSRFSESGSLIEKFVDSGEGGVSLPLYLAWINDSYLYVSPNSDNIYRYDVNGNPYGYGGGTSNSEIEDIPSGKITDLESHETTLYASVSTGIIYKYDLSSDPTNISNSRSTFTSGISSPGGMAIDDSGNLYVVSDSEDILKFSSSGSSLGVFASDGDGGMSEPYDLAWHDGHLYVSSVTEDELYRFDSSGDPYGYAQNRFNALLTDDRDLAESAGITISEDGTIYVANIDDNNILHGTIPSSATELQLDTFASGLSEPYDVVLGPSVAPNNPPSVDPIQDRTVNEGSSIIVDVNSNDLDDDSIVLSLTVKPSFATLQDNGDGTGSITLPPGYSHSGTHTITVSASDGTDSGSESFDVTVYDVNREPVLEDLENTEILVDAGASESISLSATDPDSDTLTYSIVQQNNPPSFVTLQDNGDGTAQLNITPDSDQTSAVYFVTVRVTDDGNPSLYDEVLFTITVNVIVTCGIDIPSSSVSFGAVDPDATSAEQILSITNTGNTVGVVSISAAPWVDNTDTTQMISGTTRVAIAPIGYDSKVSLSEDAQNFGILPEQGEIDLFLQLRANLIDSLFSGELNQDIEVNLVC